MGEQKRLHMIGNAHIDPVWLWTWQEGFQETKATFRSVLDRMEEYDDFIFTCSSAAFYEWIEHHDPAMFAEIAARVAEGRWELAGGWWVQSDCNIPCGESFVRQALTGQHYFLSRFSKIATYGYNVDSFGHHGMLAQILVKSGCDAYVFMRPMPNEKGLPSRLFLWESDDGSVVKAFRLPYEYCTWSDDLHDHVVRCAKEIPSSMNISMCFYGVGNHGGGPTKANIESIKSLSKGDGIPELIMSSPRRFFNEVDAKHTTLPMYHGELQHHASGCYSAHSEVKRLNRLAENRLLSAEKYAVASALVGKPVEAGSLIHAWKQVLFNQFHDILAGTSLPEAYDDAAHQYGEAISIADRIANNALQTISWSVCIPYEPGCQPLVVFNPHAWDTCAPVSLELGKFHPEAVLVDEQDYEVPFQIVRSHAAANGRNRVSFLACLPSFGWKTYRFRQGLKEHREKIPTPMVASDVSMENQWFRIDFDPKSGSIISILDKGTGTSVVKGKAAMPVLIEDASDTWSHGIFSYWGRGTVREPQCVSVRLVEHGPVVSTIEVTHVHGDSRIMQRFSLYASLRRVDVHVTVDWHERHTILKLRFPLNLDFRTAICEIPFGCIERGFTGEEESGQTWMDCSGQLKGQKLLYGLSIANDCKHSMDFQLDTMDLTVLRSPIYAHHDPMAPDPEAGYLFQDQGVQTFHYCIVPHAGNWRDSPVLRVAAELNQSPYCLKESFHEGELAQSGSLVTIDCPNIVMSAFKPAHDGRGFILRCREAFGEHTNVRFMLSSIGCTFQALFTPFEIKTFRIEASSGENQWRITETNLLEFTPSEMERIASASRTPWEK